MKFKFQMISSSSHKNHWTWAKLSREVLSRWSKTSRREAHQLWAERKALPMALKANAREVSGVKGLRGWTAIELNFCIHESQYLFQIKNFCVIIKLKVDESRETFNWQHWNRMWWNDVLVAKSLVNIEQGNLLPPEVGTFFMCWEINWIVRSFSFDCWNFRVDFLSSYCVASIEVLVFTTDIVIEFLVWGESIMFSLTNAMRDNILEHHLNAQHYYLNCLIIDKFQLIVPTTGQKSAVD